ncbi:hypothetical protein FRC12_005567 [Ceratobasidium sp. 428]|nr:hypothetical protein FRC12_005567 [Ceratobasidium sp. 428]
MDLPRPLTVWNQAALGCYERTGKVPRKFQVEFAVAVGGGRDVVCIAGTGSGKSLAFVIVHFFREDFITWIVSPLNVIENQMARDYAKYGLKSVAVNAATISPELIKDIKSGKYKVIISSPEAYKDQNKLRQALLSPELADKKHVTIVDEAHCISVWGGTGFREDFKRIGDMRAFTPMDSVMCAASATLSTSVKEGVVNSLHIKPEFLNINLGNWRANLRYGLRVLKGGEKSYSEIRDFFDSSVPIEDAEQAIIFVEDYESAHAIADELRCHYGLSDNEARDFIPAYHSLLDEQTKRRIERRFREGKAKYLITTEALTMGADFSNVTLVLNWLSPSLLEIWIQRAGRNARLLALLGLCLILVTKNNVQKAIKLCESAGIEADPVMLAMKMEENDEPEESTQQETPDVADRPATSKRTTMSLGMAEYIATGAAGGCLTAVIDRYFSNPAHTPCLEVGGCENCVKRQAADESAQEIDRLQAQRREARDAPIVIEDEEHLKHKVAQPTSAGIRPLAERRRFLEAILDWRSQKLDEILLVHDYTLDAIMTQKEAERIAKTRGITACEDFDRPEVDWPASNNLRLELVTILFDLQRAEDMKKAEEEALARAQAEEKKQKEEEDRCIAAENQAKKAIPKPKVKKEKAVPKSDAPSPVLHVAPSLTRLIDSGSSLGSQGHFGVFKVDLGNQPTPTSQRRNARASSSTIPILMTPITPKMPSIPLPAVDTAHTPSNNTPIASTSQIPNAMPGPNPVGRAILGQGGVVIATLLTPESTPDSMHQPVNLPPVRTIE